MTQQSDTYRALELACRAEAVLTTTPAARTALKDMAHEYKQMADWLERQWPEARPPN